MWSIESKGYIVFNYVEKEIGICKVHAMDVLGAPTGTMKENILNLLVEVEGEDWIVWEDVPTILGYVFPIGTFCSPHGFFS